MSTRSGTLRILQPLTARLRQLSQDASGAATGETQPEQSAAGQPDIQATDRQIAGAIAYVRDRMTQKAPWDAVSLANGFDQDSDAAALLHGLIAFKNGDQEGAWNHFARVPAKVWAARVPYEATRSGLKHDRDRVLAEMRRLPTLNAAELPVRSWFELTGAAFGVRDVALARRFYDRFAQAAKRDPQQWSQSRRQLAWLKPWVAEGGRRSPVKRVEDHVSIGVLAFDSPQRSIASRNVGDPVQSLAAIGHLVRHRVRLHGDPEVVSAMEYFQQQVPEDMRRDTEADVDVTVVDRDVTLLNDIPENTWMLVIGWWMYPLFSIDYQLPLNENIKPIILSFHCRHPSFLTPQTVDYLQKNGPVGCRDWTTVDLLLKAGVPAFFSGCITSTVSTVFDRHRVIDREETMYVEVPDTPEGAATSVQADDAMRDQPTADQLRRAHAMLDNYRHYRDIRTHRLHCYMPMRSLGMDVTFLPKNPGDSRFPGLGEINDDEFNAIRDGINDLIEPVMTAILQKQDESSIRQLWRELTAGRVAEARKRFAAPVRQLAVGRDDTSQLAAARAAIRTVFRGDKAEGSKTVTIVTPINRQQVTPFQVLLTSTMSRTKRPVDWLVVATDVPESSIGTSSQLARAAAKYPNLTLRSVKSTEVPKAALTLSLPDFQDADRILQLNAESVILGDVADLVDMPLNGRSAAVAIANQTPGSGMEELRQAASQLRHQARSHELRREALVRQPLGLRSLRNDIVLLNATRLRDQHAGELGRQYARELRLTNRQQILLFIGADHVELPSAWTQQAGPDDLPSTAAFVNFAARPKPWQPGIGYNSDLWYGEREATLPN